MKDELGGQIMRKCVGVRTETCSYLKGNSDEDEKAKGTKKVCLKKKT